MPAFPGFLAHSLRSPFRVVAVCAALVAVAGACGPARAAPSLLIDAASGEVLEQQEATRAWFPASTTKLMTVYVALDAVAAGRISLNTPLVVSPRAMSMSPTKMGFLPGTQVTLDNALKMLMLKSANDIAVTIAEGVSGSVEAFATEMNAAAGRIGMRESRWYNPNGLPDARQVSSARDLALLGQALLQRFPERADLFNIGAIRLGSQVLQTHNGMLGRYAGADGMKTGFTCGSGFNIVASATRNGRKLIAVVLGAPSATARDLKTASLFDHGFSGRTSSGGSLAGLSTTGGDAPDLRDSVCRSRGKALAQYLSEIDGAPAPVEVPARKSIRGRGGRAATTSIPAWGIATQPKLAFAPIDVFVGPVPGWTGTVAHADDYAGPPPEAAATAAAYAATKAVETPLPASPSALPMRRFKPSGSARANLIAKPEAPVEGEDSAASAGKGKASGKDLSKAGKKIAAVDRTHGDKGHAEKAAGKKARGEKPVGAQHATGTVASHATTSADRKHAGKSKPSAAEDE